VYYSVPAPTTNINKQAAPQSETDVTIIIQQTSKTAMGKPMNAADVL